ncbi:tetratricopeptide repeat protein [Spirosoma sp. HMF4905]|uniref:Tetratricopeptide repeat protein n=1 Tax=Spirosoma arboris TaxID=2682092 RepID=A0A7K1SBC8_9BACT|nr:caspase family protein [Spirosoma arboris]MVM31122.1 tetratricopeptide repeat protein [Spirosoma arboris]
MARSVYVSSQLLASRWVFFGWIGFVLLIPNSLYAQSSVERTVQQLTKSADNESDPAKAEALYTKALQLLPNADAVRIGRAIVRGRLGRYAEGIADATAAIALVDTAARYYAQRAYLLVQISEYDRAAFDYSRAIQLKPKEATYYSGLSYCRVKQNRLAEALTTAQKGIDLNPNSPYPYRNRGRAKLYSGKPDEAIADFQRSLDQQHGEAYRVLTDLGEAYELKKDYAHAADYYTKALAQKPGYPDAEVRQQGLLKQGLLPSKTSGIPNTGVTKPAETNAVASTFTGKRVALVIGNSEYLNIAPPLQDQPINDAKAINTRLRELGFSSIIETNTEEKTLRDKLNDFYETATDADLVFFYFAGHGLQYNGANYLLPTDIEVHPTIPKRYDEDLTKHAFLITTLIEQLQKKNPRFCVIVLDACREDPLKNVKAPVDGADGMPRFTPPPFTPIVVENFIRNCCVAQATTAGNRAWNGPGRNGCYTEALLRHLKKGHTLEQALKSVRSEVLETSQKAGTLQRPEYLNQTTDELIF